jgi:hypothetical protein
MAQSAVALRAERDCAESLAPYTPAVEKAEQAGPILPEFLVVERDWRARPAGGDADATQPLGTAPGDRSLAVGIRISKHCNLDRPGLAAFNVGPALAAGV